MLSIGTVDRIAKYLGRIRVILNLEIWWLIGSAPDFCGRGPGFESGISHNDHDALHCAGSLCSNVNSG